MLSEEARRKRNEYHRRYRAANKAKIKAIEERYWERRAARTEQPEQEGKACQE